MEAAQAAAEVAAEAVDELILQLGLKLQQKRQHVPSGVKLPTAVVPAIAPPLMVENSQPAELGPLQASEEEDQARQHKPPQLLHHAQQDRYHADAVTAPVAAADAVEFALQPKAEVGLV